MGRRLWGRLRWNGERCAPDCQAVRLAQCQRRTRRQSRHSRLWDRLGRRLLGRSRGLPQGWLQCRFPGRSQAGAQATLCRRLRDGLQACRRDGLQTGQKMCQWMCQSLASSCLSRSFPSSLEYNFPNGCDYTQRVENGAIAHQIAL